MLDGREKRLRRLDKDKGKTFLRNRLEKSGNSAATEKLKILMKVSAPILYHNEHYFIFDLF